MNKLRQVLEKALKQEDCFVDSETGNINYIKVKDSADRIDEKLISILSQNKELKDKFFIKIKDVYVFNIQDFKFFLDENKIDNSYTKYANQIGLSSNGELVKDIDNVVLDFPFKDCVLEGGQSTEEGIDISFKYSDKTKKYEKDESSRKEIFFNQILAHDEIDRLFDKKALVNWKRFNKDSKKDGEAVKEIKRNKNNLIQENILIKGNNLITLHNLRSEFANKIKLIYLDPPYNTPGEANTFSYNNSFNHSSWLTFMKNRIEVAKDLVSEDGFICLAIDDVEYAYLKVLCDDILGRENFLATVIVQIKKEGRTDSKFFATSHDYAIFYCKNKDKAVINNLTISEENSRKWKELDETSRYQWRDFVRTGGNSTPKDRPNQDYIIYYSKNKKEIVGVGGYSESEPSEPYKSNVVYVINSDGEFEEITKKELLTLHKNLIEFNPLGSKNERQVWRWSDREKVLWATKMGEIAVIDNKVKIKDRIKDGSKPTTTWYDSEFNATSHGTLLLKKMFDGKKVFSYPKSLFTMTDIISVSTNNNSNDIILDVFGGSATTAHAVNRVNKIDKGNRKFIVVEQMEYIETATLPRIQKSLNNKEESFLYFELAKWNEQAKEEIQNSKDLSSLIKLFDALYEKYFLNYNVNIKNFKEKIIKEENFKKLSLNEQKKMFLSMLDLNQMYVQESEMSDKKFGISKEDQKLTKEFYQK